MENVPMELRGWNKQQVTFAKEDSRLMPLFEQLSEMDAATTS
jgi:hypothetical protein